MKIIKSPFLFVGSIAAVAMAAGAFYYLVISTEGFNPIGGAYLLVMLFALVIVLLIEQKILNKFRPGAMSIWLAESLALILIITYYIYSERQIIYQATADTDWFVIVKDESLIQEKGKRSFPFDKTFEIPENGVLFVNPDEIGNVNKREVKVNSQWDNKDYRISGTTVQIDSKNYEIDIYYTQVTDSTIPDKQKILEIVKNLNDLN